MIDLARENGVRRMVALTDADNLPSQRVLQRAGFVEAGRTSTGDAAEAAQLRWVRDPL